MPRWNRMLLMPKAAAETERSRESGKSSRSGGAAVDANAAMVSC